MLGLGVLFVLTTALAFGAQGYYARGREVAATAEHLRDFVPQVRVAAVKASDGVTLVSLPATTTAYQAVDMFARASGYIEKREADIGDRVKQGQLLAKISVPELDDQILQAEATLVQLQATLEASPGECRLGAGNLGPRQTAGQGRLGHQAARHDRLQTLKAQQAAVGVAQANVNAEQQQLRVLRQQQDYQQVVAPFDGVITQRNIDVGSLVQADSTSGTFMFSIMQGNVIRTQVFVPQDQAFGLAPGSRPHSRFPRSPAAPFPAR